MMMIDLKGGLSKTFRFRFKFCSVHSSTAEPNFIEYPDLSALWFVFVLSVLLVLQIQFSHSCESEMQSQGSVSKLSPSVLLIRHKTPHNTNSLHIGADEDGLSNDSFADTAMNRLPCL